MIRLIVVFEGILFPRRRIKSLVGRTVIGGLVTVGDK